MLDVSDDVSHEIQVRREAIMTIMISPSILSHHSLILLAVPLLVLVTSVQPLIEKLFESKSSLNREQWRPTKWGALSHREDSPSERSSLSSKIMIIFHWSLRSLRLPKKFSKVFMRELLRNLSVLLYLLHLLTVRIQLFLLLFARKLSLMYNSSFESILRI